MNRVDLLLYKALRKTGASPKQSVDQHSKFTYDLAFDEIDYKVFFYFIETFFKINISDQELVHFQTVESSANYLRSRQN